MAKAEFKCGRCNRTFRMKAHWARHMSAAHGRKRKRAAAKKRKAKTRKLKKRRVKRLGRPKKAASQAKLRSLSLEQLGELISAARAEARRRIAAIQKTMK